MTASSTVRCEGCAGTGQRTLTSLEQETLSALRHRWETTAVIAGRLDQRLQPTALCNRLVRLKALGLAVSRQASRRQLEWRRTSP